MQMPLSEQRRYHATHPLAGKLSDKQKKKLLKQQKEQVHWPRMCVCGCTDFVFVSAEERAEGEGKGAEEEGERGSEKSGGRSEAVGEARESSQEERERSGQEAG